MTAITHLSENVTLVNRDIQSTLSYVENENHAGPCGQEAESDVDHSHDIDLEDISEDVCCASYASQFHQDAITRAGYGPYQVVLLVIVGLALAADLAEILSVVFLVPSAGQELCLSNSDRTWLGGIVLCGMLIGSVLWGLLGDKIGRRRALLSAILINALFAIIAAFMPNYSLLVLTRLISGIGAGGVMPTAIVYYGEFIGKHMRGQKVTMLSLLFSFGGIFVALMAWAIIPKTGSVLMGENQKYFCSWRVFSILCSVPAFVSAISLTFVPESPRFLLEAGREVEAVLIYKWIYKVNYCKRQHTRQNSISELELPSRQQLFGITPRPITRSLVIGTLKGLDTFWESMTHICLPPSARTTFILATLWCTTAFSYFGLSFWLPQHLQRIEALVYSHHVRYHRDEFFKDVIFNSTLENVHFIHFFNQVLCTHVAVLPGTVITALTIDKLGRTKLLGISLFVAGFTSLCIWPLNTRSSIIAFEAFTNVLFVIIWSTIQVVTTEVYKVNVRTSAFGIHVAVSRAAGILGCLFFGEIAGDSKAIPILMSLTAMLLAGIISVKLPDTRELLL